jgi:uroporphyrinogen III methyltransferase/synthase
VVPPDSYAELDAALSGLTSYDWIVFTSVNGVRAVLERLEVVGSITSLVEVAIAAVGPRTAAALSESGVPVAHVPRVHRAGALAESLAPIEGKTILLTRTDIAGSSLSERLMSRGASRVDDVVAYRTVPIAPESSALGELRSGVDAILFTSPSTVRGFVSVGAEWQELLRGTTIASVGPATTMAARDVGLEIHVEGGVRTMDALVDALERWFEETNEA